MICKNCKKEIADGSKFCEFCGSPQDAPQQAQPQQSQPQQQPANGQYQQQQPQAGQYQQPQYGAAPTQFNAAPKQPMDPMVKKFIIGIVALVAIVAGIFFGYKKFHREKVNIEKYVKIKCEGYDGNGTASYDFDYKNFAKDLLKALGLSSSKDLEELTEKDKYEKLGECIADMYKSMEFDKDKKLSNGDEIVLSFEYDNDLIDKYGIKFTGSEVKYKVKGLDKVKEVDPFEDVEVTFSGVSPNVSATVKNNSTEESLQYVYYSVDKSYDLKEGDEITVSIDADDENTAQNYGVVFTQKEKKFKVENVDKYISSTDDIDETFLSEMCKQTEDVINAYLAEKNDDFAPTEAIKYEGYYFLNLKNENAYDYHNKMYIVYSATIHNKKNDGKKKKDPDYDENAFADTKVYFPVYLTNLMKYADGSSFVDYTYVDKYAIKGETDLNAGWNYVKGYTSIDLMKNALIDSELASYEYTGVGAFAGQ